mgnify:FL=1
MPYSMFWRGKTKKLPVVDYREHVKSNYYYEKKLRINAKYNVFLRKFKSFGCVLFERVSENQNRIKQPRWLESLLKFRDWTNLPPKSNGFYPISTRKYKRCCLLDALNRFVVKFVANTSYVLCFIMHNYVWRWMTIPAVKPDLCILLCLSVFHIDKRVSLVNRQASGWRTSAPVLLRLRDTYEKSSGNIAWSSSKSMQSSSETSTSSTPPQPLIIQENISASDKLAKTSCLGSPSSSQYTQYSFMILFYLLVWCFLSCIIK